VHGHFHYEIKPHKQVWWNGGREGEINCGVDYLHNAEWAMSPKECHFSGENFQKGAGAHIVAKHFWRVETHNGFLNGFGYRVICPPMYIDLYPTGNVSESKWWGGPNAVRFVNFGEACPWPQ
jgi:hypothetical protein